VLLHQTAEVGGDFDSAFAFIAPELNADRVAKPLTGLFADGFEDAENVPFDLKSTLSSSLGCMDRIDVAQDRPMAQLTCDLSAISSDDRLRYHELRVRLYAALISWREIGGG
jgi:hypothetical protein